jgi:plasmid stabilization system protein ParE
MEPTYQIVLSSGAQQNLRDIYDYLHDHVSLETAEHVKEGLEAAIATYRNHRKQTGY